MKYLRSFGLPSERDEAGYILSFPAKLEMRCYADNIYPFRIFPPKRLERIEFEQITMFYGGNGSGKSTLLNVIAQKLSLERDAPFNNTPFIDEYIKLCDCTLSFGKKAPPGSRIITSDDVFDFLLDIRSLNEGIDRRREELFEEYSKTKTEYYTLKSLDDYDEFKRHIEAKTRTMSSYVTRRVPRELPGRSNGESAFEYFTRKIGENALYLLDEPENSLSAKLQMQLAQFIEDSARFYNCQFVISTHSPFLLSMKEAKIYDLDLVPVAEKRWTELENVCVYHDFFESHRKEFD